MLEVERGKQLHRSASRRYCAAISACACARILYRLAMRTARARMSFAKKMNNHKTVRITCFSHVSNKRTIPIETTTISANRAYSYTNDAYKVK